MHYISPKTLDDAVAHLANGQFKVLAGGTDLYPALRDRPVEANIIDISGISRLRGIEKRENYWHIGPCTTWTDLVRADLPACFSGLQRAASEIGSVQIQNAGTIAGNLCNASPAADSVPPLLALNAQLELLSTRGTRNVSLSDFITGVRKTVLHPDEIVSCIMVPDVNAASSFSKLGSRKYLVISIAMVAATVVFNQDRSVAEARIAVGACSPVAQRLRRLEKDLVGTDLTRSSISNLLTQDHFGDLSPIDDIRSDHVYRQEAARELVQRVLLDCANQLPGAHS